MIYKKIHYYRQLKNVRHSKTYVFFIVSNQENILITTEKNWRERKNCLDELFCAVFFVCLFLFFVLNLIGQSFRQKFWHYFHLFPCIAFCLLKLPEVWKKKIEVSQSIFLQVVFRKHEIYKIRFRLRFAFSFI